MLIHHLSGRTSEWCLARQHLPEHHAQRVQVRADVHTNSRELLRASKLRCTSKSSWNRNRSFSRRVGCGLRQPKVDDFCGRSASLLQTHHDVGGFDVPVNELLLVDCRQTGSNLCRNFQRELYIEPAGAFDKVLQGLSLHKLHRVEVILAGSPKMENRGNIRVTEASCRAGFTQKTKACRLIADIFFANDL